MGFRSLQHLRNRRSTSRRLCLPASFRLQGLVTLVAASSLRFRAGFVSHRQRSWDSPFGAFSSRKVSDSFPDRKNPPTVSLVGIPVPKHRPARQVAVPGLLPFRESLAVKRAVNTPTAGCSLGFHPSRDSTNALARISPCLLSRASPVRAVHPGDGAPESQSTFASPRPSLRQAAGVGRDTLLGFLHRPCHPDAFGRPANRAILFTSRRVAHYCRLIDALWLAEHPTGVVRIG